MTDIHDDGSTCRCEELREALGALVEATSEIQWSAELGFLEEGGCSQCGRNETAHTSGCPVGSALDRAQRLLAEPDNYRQS